MRGRKMVLGSILAHCMAPAEDACHGGCAKPGEKAVKPSLESACLAIRLLMSLPDELDTPYVCFPEDGEISMSWTAVKEDGKWSGEVATGPYGDGLDLECSAHVLRFPPDFPSGGRSEVTAEWSADGYDAIGLREVPEAVVKELVKRFPEEAS